jgi:hypothetical protein
MCWSRKGVPGSKRSGEAGTPFLGPAAEPNFGSVRAAARPTGVRFISGQPTGHPERQEDARCESPGTPDGTTIETSLDLATHHLHRARGTPDIQTLYVGTRVPGEYHRQGGRQPHQVHLDQVDSKEAHGPGRVGAKRAFSPNGVGSTPTTPTICPKVEPPRSPVRGPGLRRPRAARSEFDSCLKRSGKLAERPLGCTW